MILDKTYCLHYPALIQRKELLLKRFKELDMEVEWVEGFLPENIKETPKGMKNKGELSLYLKHKYVLNEQINNNIERVLILEDDVILPDGFDQFYNNCIKEFEQLRGDILFLGICCGILPKNIEKNKFVYFDPSYRSRCTHCYTIKLETAKKIIGLLDNHNRPIDWKLNECIETQNLRSCYAEPGIHQASQAGLFQSSLYN
jgi:GR25 family glycosyltransferase involved in LPS biosynthesis